MYDFARYAIRKNEQFPFEWMYSHAVSISNSVVRGFKPKNVRFLRVQISSKGKMCFVVPVSHLSKQALHVTARDISHEPPKGKIRCMTARDRLRAWDVNFLGSSNLIRAWPGSQPNAIDRGGGRITPPQANFQTNDRSETGEVALERSRRDGSKALLKFS